MKRRDLAKALLRGDCHIEREGKEHTIWRCPCGRHLAAVPRHRDITAGVVGKIQQQMACLGERWLA